MIYENTVKGRFVRRPNRFIAEVDIGGERHTVHVKNTGRCRELLLPDAEVILQRCDAPSRKTAYDLIAVYKEGFGLVNIDSQAPNKVMAEWLAGQDFSLVRPEYTWGASRFDFYMERGEQRWLVEVKGCTLEVEGIGYFPDAPTQRGTKHLKELAAAAKEGYRCALAFVIQMPNVDTVLPNTATDPAFAAALEEAKSAGVRVLFLHCAVTENKLRITDSPSEVLL